MVDVGRIDQLIDHGADLQRQVDQLNDEILTIAICAMGLAIAVAIVSWKLWHEQ